MIFKPFSRMIVLVSVCALFTAAASKPARLSSESLGKHTTNVAGTGTQTLKQFNARAPHSHTHPKRQTSAIAAERIAPAADSDNADAAAPSPASGNLVHVSVAAKPKPTGLSRRQNVLGLGTTKLTQTDEIVDVLNSNSKQLSKLAEDSTTAIKQITDPETLL